MSRFVLTDAQFAALARLLHDTAGLAFDDSRRDSLAFGVAERVRACRVSDVDRYVALVTAPDGAAERQALLDEVTIPETHFFRNPPQVRALRRHVLPELLRQAGAARRLRIWSAGCSTGEEPYTVAMLVRELLADLSGWDVQIVATDISTRALAAAATGCYGERSLVMTEPSDRERFFVLDADAGGYRVRDEVRELVTFRHHNLVTAAPPFEPGEVDLVLCRNVTIYFERATTKQLMRRLHATLRDGGYLFLGHAETLWQVSEEFRLVTLGDAFVYRRTDADDGPQRRSVLPDRRTEAEPLVALADRRRGPRDRRLLPRSAGRPAPARRPTAPADAGPPAPAAPDPLPALRRALAEGRYGDAADLAADVAAAQPLRAEAHYLHGVALTSLGRDAEALVVLRKAVYLDGEDGFAHFLLAGALARCGERVAAARCYRAAAATLGRRAADAVAPELGGRSVGELVALCGRLARSLEPRPGREAG